MPKDPLLPDGAGIVNNADSPRPMQVRGGDEHLTQRPQLPTREGEQPPADPEARRGVLPREGREMGLADYPASALDGVPGADRCRPADFVEPLGRNRKRRT